MYFFFGGGGVGGQNKMKKELFMIIKFDVASSTVSPFKYYFLLETSESVIIVMSANFHNIQFYSQWNSSVLLRTL